MKEIEKRRKMLNWLIVETECRDENETYRSILNKALRALNKENFTGIIRLTSYEKEMLSLLDEEMMPEAEKKAIRHYTR